MGGTGGAGGMGGSGAMDAAGGAGGTTNPPPGDGGGCGCRVADPAPSKAPLALLSLLGLASLLRRRKITPR